MNDGTHKPELIVGDNSPVDGMTPESPAPQRRSRGSRFHLPAGYYVVSIVSMFFFLLILESLAIVGLTYGPSPAAARGEANGWVWNLIMAAVLIWALLNLVWAIPSFRSHRRVAGFTHLGLVLCCGILALGLHALLVARAWNSAPLILDYSQTAAASLPPPQVQAVSAAPGDPAEGRKLFSTTCVTCHGPTGDGLSNLAPSLRTSDFIKSAEPQAITRVITLGRPITDPSNRSGKMMPAKGGNPFLTAQQISHLVAFVKQLPGETQASIGATAKAGDAVQLARWVLPAAAAPPAGFRKLVSNKDPLSASEIAERQQRRRSQVVQQLKLSSIAVHALFLVGLLTASTELVFGWLLGLRRPGRGGFAMILWGWLLASAAWVCIALAFWST